MKVTFVLPGVARHPIGGYKVVYTYANHLAANGHVVEVLQARTRSDRSVHELAVRLAYLVWRRRRPSWFQLHPSVVVRNASTLHPRLVDVDVDVVVATSVGTADFVAALSSESRVPVYLIQHFEDFSVAKSEVLRTWRLPMRRIVVSGWLEAIGSAEGLASDLVENGVDAELFSPGPTTMLRRARVLAMVSDQDWKRSDLVTELMNRIAMSKPECELETFGTCPRPAGLPDSAQHLQDPPLDVLVAAYQHAQIFVCASDFEGFGLPVLEAMACGAAVVSTDNGGVTTFAQGAVRIVPRGSVDDLASSVLGLLEDDDQRLALCQRGLARATELSLSATSARFEAVLANAVASRG